MSWLRQCTKTHILIADSLQMCALVCAKILTLTNSYVHHFIFQRVTTNTTVNAFKHIKFYTFWHFDHKFSDNFTKCPPGKFLPPVLNTSIWLIAFPQVEHSKRIWSSKHIQSLTMNCHPADEQMAENSEKWICFRKEIEVLLSMCKEIHRS